MSSKTKITEESIVIKWHYHLSNHSKGQMASLRRCDTIQKILFEPAYSRLKETLAENGFHYSKDRIALVAGVMSHLKVKEGDKHSKGSGFAEAMAAGKDGPAIKVNRFQLLIQHETPEEVFIPVIRIVGQIGDSVNLYSLARDLLKFGNGIREKWAETYQSKVFPTIKMG